MADKTTHPSGRGPGVPAPGGRPKAAAPAEAEAQLTSEASQRIYDLTVLYQTLRELRGLLANAKVNYRIASVIGIENIHPKQFHKAVSEHRKHIDLVVGLIKDLEADEDAQLPEPSTSSIQVVSSLPSD